VPKAEHAELQHLLRIIDKICDAEVSAAEKGARLEQLSMALRPQFPNHLRQEFVQRAIARGVVETAVQLIESGSVELAIATSNFLGDFTFGSDMGARAVEESFDRIARRFKHIFETLEWNNLELLEATVLLCVNMASMCPSSHQLIVPLVQPVCLRIIEDLRASDVLRGNTITLLANLSTTVCEELRVLRVADTLLDLVVVRKFPDEGISVAESVIIYLHGHERCAQVDKLMDLDVVGEYCVPLMETTLAGQEFRGMYPYLMYTARVFKVLAQSEEYAKALVSHERVVPLLLKASSCRDLNRGAMLVESDREGRSLALEALCLFAQLRLWPMSSGDRQGWTFIRDELPLLMQDEHAEVRAAAASLWCYLNIGYVKCLLRAGDPKLPHFLWRRKVLTFLYPLLELSTSAF